MNNMIRNDCILIENDLFGIGDRLKAIDPAYFVVYNRGRGRFEVHNSRQRRRDTLALAVPYRSLDARTVSLTLKTRRENIEKLVAEMELNNKRLEESSDKRVLDNARGRLEEEIGKAK